MKYDRFGYLSSNREDWIQTDEDEHCEFKEAKSSLSYITLVNYCIALSNEGGGCLVLGVVLEDKKVVLLGVERKVPNGGSCYIRGKETINKIIKYKR
jgi:predicted HTH transcriptional regulator